jgi:TRAP-type C4-dicarboxylate transport system permease small subunit
VGGALPLIRLSASFTNRQSTCREEGGIVSDNPINCAINKLAGWLEKLMIVLVTAMMLSLFWQVFTRFVIKIPSIWTEEIARYSFIFLVMIGAALGVKNSVHFGMTLVSDKLHGKVRDIYQRYVINVIILICAIYLVYYGIEFTRMYGLNRVSPTFLVPMAWVFAIVPISGLLMIVFSFQNIMYGDFSKDPYALPTDEGEVG